jgi:hypothetical protein
MMPTNYLLPTTNSQVSKDFFVVKVLIGKMSNLEKLDEFRQEVVEIIKKHQWNHALWAHQHYKNKSKM